MNSLILNATEMVLVWNIIKVQRWKMYWLKCSMLSIESIRIFSVKKTLFTIFQTVSNQCFWKGNWKLAETNRRILKVDFKENKQNRAKEDLNGSRISLVRFVIASAPTIKFAFICEEKKEQYLSAPYTLSVHTNQMKSKTDEQNMKISKVILMTKWINGSEEWYRRLTVIAMS